MVTELKLILASASRSRQSLLHNAGLTFTVEPSGVDEDAIKDSFLQSNDQDLTDLPMILAQAKALDISARRGDAVVIGADQVLIGDDRVFSKPPSHEAARTQLLELRGRTHRLETAVALALNGEITWSWSEAAYLTMREFSPEALGQYLVTAGKAVSDSVGGYKIEGPAIQLFECIEGDYFSILGLPLLALLAELRNQGLVLD